MQGPRGPVMQWFLRPNPVLGVQETLLPVSARQQPLLLVCCQLSLEGSFQQLGGFERLGCRSRWPCAVPEAGFSPEDGKKGRGPLKHTEVFCSIASRSLLSPSYYHSFGVTENYVVFLEQPFRMDILKMATAYIRGASWASCLAFHGEDKVRPGR